MIGLEKPSSFCGRRPRQAYSFGLTGDPYACPASRQPVAAPEPEVELTGDDELAAVFAGLSEEEAASLSRAAWLDERCDRVDQEHDEGFVSFVEQ